MAEHICLIHNQKTKLNTHTKTQVNYQVSLSVESMLSTLSYNEKIFQGSPSPYQKALKNSGYKHTRSFECPKNDINSANVNKQ